MSVAVFVLGLEDSKEHHQSALRKLADLGIEVRLWLGVEG